jgi:hypothetical protein
MSKILEFPLIWRWTSKSHAIFSKFELAALYPCSAVEAARIYDETRSFDTRDGLDERQFKSLLTKSAAAIPPSESFAWLRARVSNLAEQIIVSWNRETALRTDWELFTARWDHFCYPSSDDVLILPENDSWVLRYYHSEMFYSASTKAKDCRWSLKIEK